MFLAEFQNAGSGVCCGGSGCVSDCCSDSGVLGVRGTGSWGGSAWWYLGQREVWQAEAVQKIDVMFWFHESCEQENGFFVVVFGDCFVVGSWRVGSVGAGSAAVDGRCGILRGAVGRCNGHFFSEKTEKINLVTSFPRESRTARDRHEVCTSPVAGWRARSTQAGSSPPGPSSLGSSLQNAHLAGR